MSQKNFTALNTPDKNLQLIQNNIQKAVTSLQSSPFQGGNYLTDISVLTGTPKIINHKLGRTPVIWALGDNNANAVVWRSAWTETTITLNSSADCTISLWVN